MNPAKKQLELLRGRPLSSQERVNLATELAALILEQARKAQKRRERKRQAQLAKLMNDPLAKAFTTSLADQCFRSHDPDRIANQMIYLIQRFGIPSYLSSLDKLKLKFFVGYGYHHARQFIPFVVEQVRREMSSVILPGEPKQLSRQIARRHKAGLSVNLNHLGEAILGEEEAQQRLETYLADLARPEVEVISVKISSICSQINLLAPDETLAILRDRLRQLYRAAASHLYKKRPKFVNLDMEEYRDLKLTVALFQSVLNEPEFFNHSAGIALQAYLPDSFEIQQEITTWALQRVAEGGAPVRIRIVKGANLAMEQVEASIEGWRQAPYQTKLEVDANYKRMVTFGCRPAHAAAVHLGIASHNLFDIAYALILRAENEVESHVTFEMLEGMADALLKVVRELSGKMLVYCPAAETKEFHVAVAYLIRRLDENTSPDNFLRDFFNLKLGSEQWERQKQLFTLSCAKMGEVSSQPRRVQNRWIDADRVSLNTPFHNEPSTDWSLPHHHRWAETIIADGLSSPLERIPLVIAGREMHSRANFGEGWDPSRPGKPLYTYTLAGEKEIDAALNSAKQAQKDWSTLSATHRASLLIGAAHLFRQSRKELIQAMIADGGKIIFEADHEVSEAIDFLEYYARQVIHLGCIEEVSWRSRGTILVAPPWNFPCAISTGGVAASLAAGNCVLFKPAPEAVLVGWKIAQLFWKAGIPQEVLQFINCAEEPVGSGLIRDPRLNGVVLTGATSTARLFMKIRPDLHLSGETGGKNSIVITDLADRDLAIQSLIASAFGHAGQKCSAASLAICLPEIYEDQLFLNTLRDAAESLVIGSAWNLATKVNPLIKPPSGPLLRELTRLEEGEEWLLQPKANPDNPNLWTPGIKLGVRPGAFTHTTELFGPVLGLMRAESLDQACDLANATPYGLTAGLQTLDSREMERWSRRIEAGNLYINRTITGAVVNRQPFGGTKRSSFGAGHKAGGPNYLIQLMHADSQALPKEQLEPSFKIQALEKWIEEVESSREKIELFQISLRSYAYWWSRFAKPADPARLVGQDNLFRYLPRSGLALRLQSNDRPVDIARACAAAIMCRSRLEVSWDPQESLSLPEVWPAPLFLVEESLERFCGRVVEGEVARIRTVSPAPSQIYAAAARGDGYVCDDPVQATGRLELLHYLREVVICTNYHRYGNLGAREGEFRSPVE
jgi:RHH-type transcriptional regulator, proline utilization regulon repressor / proline dehydrogenase / delta 1-pyrroline-5-carboxylate dehydrogenase